MARDISQNIQKEIDFIKQESIKINVSKITILSVTDNAESVVASIFFNGDDKTMLNITIWDGQDYIDIGQWTDANVDNRIKELLSL